MKKLLSLIALLFMAGGLSAQTWPAPDAANPQVWQPQTPANYGVIGEPAAIASNFNIWDFIRGDHYAMPAITSDEGAMRSHCEASHLNYDDPILFPGQVGASHLHMYYGNTLTNANSTYNSLRTTGDSTCGGKKINRSAYWHPAVIDEGVVRVPDYAVIYYKLDAADKALGNRIPRGFNMITGFNMNDPASTSTADYGGVVDGKGLWTCIDTGAQSPYLSADGGLTAAFDCPATSQIRIGGSTPQCWKGDAVGSANGRSHVTHRRYHPNGGRVCPNGYYLIWHFDLNVFFSHEGPDDYKKWRLSSDDHVMPNGTPVSYKNGESFHFDWFDGWDTDVRNAFERDAIGVNYTYPSGTGTPRSLNTSCFGDVDNSGGDTAVDCGANDHLFLSALPEGQRTTAIPADPTPNSAENHVHLKTHGIMGGYRGDDPEANAKFADNTGQLVVVGAIVLLIVMFIVVALMRRRKKSMIVEERG